MEQHLQRTATRLQQHSSGITRQNSLVTLISSQLFRPCCIPLRAFLLLFPVIMSCPHMHVKLANSRHEVCNEKHASTHSPISFCVLACLNPFVSLSLHLHLIDVTSLVAVFGINVRFGSAAVNIISTLQSSLLALSLPFLCSISSMVIFYLHAIVVYRIISPSIPFFTFSIQHPPPPHPPQRGGV